MPGRNGTSGPASATVPTNSCPSTVPHSNPGTRPATGSRSAPQMAVAATATIASPGSLMPGSGTSATSTTSGPAATTALTGGPPRSSAHRRTHEVTAPAVSAGTARALPLTTREAMR